MLRAAFFDADRDASEFRAINVEADVHDVIETVTRMSSSRGHPSVDFTRLDNSVLTLSTDGRRAFLVWTDALGESLAGRGAHAGPPLIYDYFGSWSEAPGDALASLDEATDCIMRFMVSGIPDTMDVIFVPE